MQSPSPEHPGCEMYAWASGAKFNTPTAERVATVHTIIAFLNGIILLCLKVKVIIPIIPPPAKSSKEHFFVILSDHTHELREPPLDIHKIET
jgi:hypothetical protein